MFKLKADYTEYENKSLRLPKDLIDQVQNLANENNKIGRASCRERV